MDTLRARLIEAGADVVARDEYRNWSGRQSIHGIVAENVLDAFLDTLEAADTILVENGKWGLEAEPPALVTVPDLIAVLREETDQ